MDRVFYIGYYDTKENRNENRTYFLPATNKMTYIATKISQNGYKVNIISPSPTKSDKGKYKKSIRQIKEGISLTLFSTKGRKTKFGKLITHLSSRIKLLFYILKNIKKDDVVIVYHSLALMSVISFAKKIRKFKLIIEVEEIYSNAVKTKLYNINDEFKFFKKADGYIFSTELLNEKINLTNKPYTIIYGIYEQQKLEISKKLNDKINIIYAGTFDSKKGGAIKAIESAKYLDERYHFHILGFGEKSDTSKVISMIEENNLSNSCKITFGGLLEGDEFNRYLQSCDIGLSTQNLNAPFSETSFPSKVLTYMVNGLDVVSIRLKVLEKSKLKNYIHFYDVDSPIEIAKIIKKIDIKKKLSSHTIIRKLDADFKYEINQLLLKIDN